MARGVRTLEASNLRNQHQGIEYLSAVVKSNIGQLGELALNGYHDNFGYPILGEAYVKSLPRTKEIEGGQGLINGYINAPLLIIGHPPLPDINRAMAMNRVFGVDVGLVMRNNQIYESLKLAIALAKVAQINTYRHQGNQHLDDFGEVKPRFLPANAELMATIMMKESPFTTKKPDLPKDRRQNWKDEYFRLGMGIRRKTIDR